ncbi:YybH family protein [Hahella sp. KA22]|uniref:YybH family protein n=1 Tax=unclassified Hahella TaxID=2624107 RepID=UPI000FDD0884|nr:DUF4440 domain-containing protein [Hahella sp. KA22]AZZ92675.1 DUF4440 domain-containing protein [Hahella sp. KA22]QAY56048.1 DUF4440 domain-containing protein [Hahella sp. KA22]
MNVSTEVQAAILAAEKVFMNTFSQGDAAGIAACYTDNAQLMPPHADFVEGQPAIQGAFQAFMDMGVKEMKLETLEVEGYGDAASEVGKFALEGEGGQVLDQGKYVVIWKKEAGKWKLHRDIFNSSVPVPQ